MPRFLSSLFARLTTPADPPLTALWQQITRAARQPHWYVDHQVDDSVDGRFDMLILISALVMLSLERRGLVAETATLTERMAADLDGSLRDMGVGDMVVGKHMGRMMGGMGGRLSAYRAALSPGAPPDDLAAALGRNVYRGKADDQVAGRLADATRQLHRRIEALDDAALLAGVGI